MISAKVESGNTGGPFDHLEVQLAWRRVFERRVDRRFDEDCVEPMAAPSLEPEACTGRLRLTPRMERTFEKNRSDAFSLRGEARVANSAGSVSVITGFDFHHDIVSSHVETIDLQTFGRTPEANVTPTVLPYPKLRCPLPPAYDLRPKCTPRWVLAAASSS